MSALPDRFGVLLATRWSEFAVGYIALLFILFFAFLVCIPMQYHDTDMWYHLAGGRHLLETGELYNPYMASFLEPAREFINYFWGFQVTAYSIWSVTGEPGLILYKAIMLTATAWLAARIILLDRPLRHANALQLIVITLIVGILCTRSVSLRPHIGSYLFIPLFIYILMFRQKWYPVLPVLAIIWANFHGVEYVIGALICGAFFIERLYGWWQSEQRDPAQLRPVIWPLLCAPAILVNPSGMKLLLTPFIQDPNIWKFIRELQPFRPELVLDVSAGTTRNTLFWLLAGFTAYALLRAGRQVTEFLAPLLLAVGGIALLATASRFTLEWALLTTALLATQLADRDRSNTPLVTAGLAALLIAITSAYVPATRKGLHTYPLDRHSLAWGTTEFIRETGLTGRYAIAPSHAGYVEFAAPPGVQVHMDMHFPPFTSDVFHELLTAMISEPGLRHYVDRYEPDLIGVDRDNEYFASHLAVELGYVPVFFDRRIALYVNTEKHPGVAGSHALTAINPMNEGAIRSDELEQGITELRRMLKVVDIPPVKETLAGFLIETGRLQEAAEYVTELEQQQADPVTVNYLAGRVHHLQNRCDEAVGYYEAAIRDSETPEPMHLLAAECYFVMRRPDAAYDHFSAVLNPYRDSQPDAETYYQFALTALASGHQYEAEQLLQMIPRIDPTGEYHGRARELLDSITSGDR